MLKTKLNLHSVVDVITNSSTEIFVNATKTSVKTFKNFMSKILLSSGINESVDDLFEFEVNVNGCYYDEDSGEDIDINDTFPFDEFDEKYKHYSMISDEDYSVMFNYSLIVKLKDGSKINLNNEIENIFDIFEWSNG